MTGMIAHLTDLSWPAADAVLRQRPVGLLPIGAIEAHGPHLPLNTDIIIAEATAERAAQRLSASNIATLIMPTICYTVSFAGTSFAGTTPVEAEPFEAYLTSLLGQVARQGYRAVICCNAHLEPAHVAGVQRACQIAEDASGIPIRCPDQRAESHAALLGDEFRRGARHAGSYETSIVLAVRPNVVDLDEMHRLPPVWIDLPARLRAGARTFADAGAELGYFGDPARSTAEEGHTLLDALASIITTAIPAQ